ncbi:MAG: hypothetical protein COA70_03155 [Planctomycetota bacterium]|nr:MAG: hypothetical protein COA70_03155 [Planctomycetota bacterium]
MLILTPLALLVSMQSMSQLPLSQDPTLSPSQTIHHAQKGLLGGVIAAGSIDSDDFNRASLGPDWTQMNGSFAITGNLLTSVSGNDWIQRLGSVVDYADATTEFDLTHSPPGLSYSAAVTGAGIDMLWTKIQSNAGGFYDNIGFYHDVNNGAVIGTYGGFFAITPVTGGHVRISISNGGDTMNIDIDEASDGVYEWHYESTGILAAFPNLGTGVGIGGWSATMDNWDLGDGPSLTLAIAGACPSPVTISVSGASAFASVAIAYGNAGSFTIPSGPCVGTVIDISAPTLGGFFPADASGNLSLTTPPLPAGLCGMTVQAVDMSNCAVSNTATL